MSNNDGLKRSESTGAPTENENPNASGDSNETRDLVIMRVAQGSYWAELEMFDVWGLPDRRTFIVSVARYRAENNGGEGNIRLRLVSEEDTGWVELNDSAIQDGQWHPFSRKVSVAANAKHAVIHFGFIYRNQEGEVDMTVSLDRTYPRTP